jgi:ABC-type transport system involved in multi-copper enzyme maturation permease subunit
MRAAYLIARTVLIEAVRRREIYAIVLLSVLLIAFIASIDFFGLEGLSKFYRDMALKVMSTATALTTIILAARQLPREFEQRTIYPLLAKPVSRAAFMAGKLLGVLAAAGFTLGLFMAIFLAGNAYLDARAYPALFVQYVYLQMLALLIVAAMSFWLSMVLNVDAAITIALIMYFFSHVLTALLPIIYDQAHGYERWGIMALNYGMPQLTLFDLSERTIHGDKWSPLGAADLALLSAYGIGWAAVFFGFAYFVFRRRAL